MDRQREADARRQKLEHRAQAAAKQAYDIVMSGGEALQPE